MARCRLLASAVPFVSGVLAEPTNRQLMQDYFPAQRWCREKRWTKAKEFGEVAEVRVDRGCAEAVPAFGLVADFGLCAGGYPAGE